MGFDVASRIGWTLAAFAALPAIAGAVGAAALIDNSVIQLGVADTAQLNVPNGPASCGGTSVNPGATTTTVGLRYLVNGCESTSPGSCECEGWGVSYKPVAGSPVSGFANDGIGTYFPCGGPGTLFTSNAWSARSVVRVCSLQVIHDFQPSTASPNLYEVNVTLRNMSPSPISDVRYRRVMDWDVEPTAFSQFITLAASNPPPTELLASCDNGYMTSDPLAPCSYANCPSSCTVMPPLAPPNANVYDSGPDNHGALFDFGFGSFAPGASRTFTIYYGAAGSSAAAMAALTAAQAQVWSLAKCDPGVSAQCTVPGGAPNTFIFAFGGLTTPTPSPTPTTTSPPPTTTLPTTTTSQAPVTSSTSTTPPPLTTLPQRDPTRQRAPAPALGEWPMEGGDAAHSGATQPCAAAPEGGPAAWTVPITPSDHAPAVLGCLVAVPDGAALATFEAATGKPVWRRTLPGEVTASLALAPHRIYVATSAATLHALQPETGQELWRLDTGVPAQGLAASGGMLVVAAGQSVLGVDELRASVAWRHLIGAPATGTPAVQDGALFVPGGLGGLSAMDAATGLGRWQAGQAPDRPGAPVVTKGLVLAVDAQGVLHAWRADTGQEAWAARVAPPAPAAPLAGSPAPAPAVANGTVYVASADGALSAFHLNNGTLRWRFHAGGPLRGAPATGGGLVLAGSDDGRLYALDSEGRLVWKAVTRGALGGRAAVSGGLAYAVSHDGNLYALRLQDGAHDFLPEPPVPTFPAVPTGQPLDPATGASGGATLAPGAATARPAGAAGPGGEPFGGAGAAAMAPASDRGALAWAWIPAGLFVTALLLVAVRRRRRDDPGQGGR